MPLNPKAPFIKIAVLENAFEAQFLSSMLAQCDIPHRVRSYHDTAYDGLFQFQNGWGEIYSPPEFRQQILDTIADLRSQPINHHDYEPEN
jgi:hypothetical protein